MKVGSSHLTYCTNIHPGETWAEVAANLERYIPAVKQRVAPKQKFGIGLRLSARAAEELNIDTCRDLLKDLDAYVFTINGFPHGVFHGTAVKEAVYRPDWLERGRVDYTNRLADILVDIMPNDLEYGSISTVPLCFHSRAGRTQQMVDNLKRCTDHLAKLEARTGKHIMLALEPEPCCVIETIDQTIDFFADYLRDWNHIGICLDTCHAAVEFEDPATSIASLRDAGIAIAKIQVSAGLRVSPVDAAARAALAPYAEGTYLHQVVARTGTELTRFVDLPAALAADVPADEWRIHFHVPIFREQLGPFASTQAFLADFLGYTKISTHYEVETYTWDVLPAEFRAEPIDEAIARELAWVKQRL